MDTAVLWVYQQVLDKQGVPLEAGQKPSLCFRGTKHMLCVVAGHPVRVLKRTVKDFDKARHVTQNGEDYPVEKARKMLEEIGNRNGITDQAYRLLEQFFLENPIEENTFSDEEAISNLEPERPAEGKTARTSSIQAEDVRSPAGKPSVLAKVCEDLKIDPALARRTLRKKGLSRPYDDETAIRAALT